MSQQSGGYSPQQPAANFSYPSHQPAPARGNRGIGVIIASIDGISTLLGVGCCGGIVVIAYIGATSLANDVKDQLQFKPILTQHVREIKT